LRRVSIRLSIAKAIQRDELSALAALQAHHVRQAKERLAAGKRWQDYSLVFASQVGTPLDASHVRRAFKAITNRAALRENWTPRELRHSFVSLMSDNGVPIETIADLVGHASIAVTEEVYRHQLKPVITRGAETLSTIFNHNQAKSA
jgi:site-specific recombinase XerD